MWNFIIQALIAIAIDVVAYVIMPKPKSNAASAVQELEAPTAAADIPIMQVFGTVTIKSPNVLWFGDKSVRTYEVKA